MIRIWVCSVFFCTASLAAAGSPPLNDGPAEPGTWGFRPFDGQQVAVNPPGFVWRNQKGAMAYDFQCGRERSFLIVHSAGDRLEHNGHCPSKPFPPGRWFWRYRAVWENGTTSEWSRPRMFLVPSDAIDFPMPSASEIRLRIPRRHPRLFVRPEDMEDLRTNRTAEQQRRWKTLEESADRLLKEPVKIAELKSYPSGRRQNNEKDIALWRKNRRIVTRALSRASQLAFVYLIRQDERTGRKAAEWITAIAKIPPGGVTSYAYNDECAMPILYELSRAYTWAYDALKKEERALVRANMRIRGNEVYEHLTRRRMHLWHPYASHSNRAWHYLGEMGVAFYDEIPEAEKWLDFALRVYYCAYPVWSDDDGGWHEGAAYWRSYLNRVTWWLDLMQTALQIDGYRKPFFSRVGDFALYTMPPGSVHGGFGDSADTMKASSMGSLMQVFARQTGNGHWQWYADKTGQLGGGYTGFLWSRLKKPTPIPPDELPTAKLFRGVGVGHLHTDLTDSAQDVHLAFKSSPMGSQSHGFNAQNSFLLWAFGEPLLTWSGHRDWHGSPHHRKWMHETISQNAILVDGKGQIPYSVRSRGSITAFKHSQHIDLIGGECGAAYGDRLHGWERIILFAKPDWIVILDDIAAKKKATFTWLLHSGGTMRESADRVIEVEGKTARCDVSFLAPKELRFKITEGFGKLAPVGYKGRSVHLAAETASPIKRTQFLTVLIPRKGQRSDTTQVEYTEVDGGHACRLSREGRQLVVLWQPDGEGRTLEAYGVRDSARIYAKLMLEKEGRVVDLRHDP